MVCSLPGNHERACSSPPICAFFYILLGCEQVPYRLAGARPIGLSTKGVACWAERLVAYIEEKLNRVEVNNRKKKKSDHVAIGHANMDKCI